MNSRDMAQKNPISSFSARAAEIFLTAAASFQRLGELTMQLNFTADAQHHSHWTDKDLDMLQDSILRFSEDLSRISESVRDKTNTQVKLDLKRKAIDEAAYVGVMGSSSGQPAIKRKPQQIMTPTTTKRPSVGHHSAGPSVMSMKLQQAKQQPYHPFGSEDYSDDSAGDAF